MVDRLLYANRRVYTGRVPWISEPNTREQLMNGWAVGA